MARFLDNLYAVQLNPISSDKLVWMTPKKGFQIIQVSIECFNKEVIVRPSFLGNSFGKVLLHLESLSLCGT